MKADRNEFPHFLGQQIDFILPSRFPTEKAHGIVTVEMARAASELGYRVQIIAPNLSGGSVKNPEGLRVNLLNSSAIKKVVSLRDSSKGKQSHFYFKLQVFIFFISLIKNKKINPHHTYWLRDITLALLISRLSIGRKRIVLEIHRKPTPLDSFLIKLLPRKDLVLAVISQLINDNIPKNAPRSIISEMAVPKWFHRKTTINKEFTFGYFGSFSSYGIPKNVEIILEALAILSSHGETAFNAIFIGVGEDGNRRLVEKAKSLMINESQFKIIDNVEHRLIPDLMKSCEYLVFPYPYVKGIEGSFPTKLLEYASVGCPIIASDTPISRQIFTEKEISFYKSLDPISLSDTFLKISLDPDLTNKKISAARELASGFSYEARVRKIIDFLEICSS
jgi:glycosyltransferase involved in cell wall biosynthesis